MQAPNAEAAAAAEQHRIHRGTPGLRRRAAEGRPGRSYVPRFPLWKWEALTTERRELLELIHELSTPADAAS